MDLEWLSCSLMIMQRKPAHSCACGNFSFANLVQWLGDRECPGCLHRDKKISRLGKGMLVHHSNIKSNVASELRN